MPDSPLRNVVDDAVVVGVEPDGLVGAGVKRRGAGVGGRLPDEDVAESHQPGGG